MRRGFTGTMTPVPSWFSIVATETPLPPPSTPSLQPRRPSPRPHRVALLRVPSFSRRGVVLCLKFGSVLPCFRDCLREITEPRCSVPLAHVFPTHARLREVRLIGRTHTSPVARHPRLDLRCALCAQVMRLGEMVDVDLRTQRRGGVYRGPHMVTAVGRETQPVSLAFNHLGPPLVLIPNRS